MTWNLENHQVAYGQWLRARVRYRKFAISPSGKYVVYFAADWSREREVGPTWTAVSRPPYFTALALWKEQSTWGGGGIFISDNHLALHTNHLSLAEGFSLPPDWKISCSRGEGAPEHPEDYWISESLEIDSEKEYEEDTISYQKLEGDRSLIRAYIDKPYFGRYDSYIRDRGVDHLLPEGQVLEADHFGNALIAAGGRLYVLKKEQPYRGLESCQLIADVNDLRPQRSTTPDAFRSW